jgi:predicted NAD/FAD-dependent oxidoreductase
MADHKVDVLIVGAGLAGLTAAQALQGTGHSVAVVDKGRSVGGRLATRRVGGGLADHGAQYFTVRTPQFQRWVDKWEAEGLVYVWSSGFSTGSLTLNDERGHARYAVSGGMNRLAKYLAQGLSSIETNVRLARIERADDEWLTVDSEGTERRARTLLLTPPVPQSLALLDEGGTLLTPTDRASLEAIRYAPCIAAMFHYEGDLSIPNPGAVQRPAETIPWIADNHMKGISPDARVVTLHADPSYSRRYWDTADVEIVETMQSYLDPYLTESSRLVEVQVKRWLYSFPETIYPERVLVAEDLPGLLFAGDAFGGPRVEGAFLSGLAAGEYIKKKE